MFYFKKFKYFLKNLKKIMKLYITIIKNKFQNNKIRFNKELKIPGTRNLNPALEYREEYKHIKFKSVYADFQDFVLHKINNKENFSILKFGDGDYYFLKGIEIGSAKPGNRAISRKLTDLELKKYWEGLTKVDYFACEIPKEDQNRFRQILPGANIQFPAEFLYASVANKWFTKTFDGQIGLIGAAEKIELIDKLTGYPEYLKYLGLKTKPHLVSIPQKFAGDNLQETISKTLEQIQNPEISIYLVGVGHVKSGLIGELSKSTQSSFIDVGSGIDAYAGIIDIQRPFFGGWKNYQIMDENIYEKIDYLQVSNPGMIKYLKK